MTSPRSPLPAAVAEPSLITSDAEFADLCAELAGEAVYALDTEFHRERTYYPKVALVQLAWRDQVALVDPLAVDLAPLAQVLEGPGTMVIHAPAQDLEVLERACRSLPRSLFDTQVAAGFLGMPLPSLSALHEREFGRPLPKGDRLTDWLARPLSEQQLAYAAADVSGLVELHRRLTDKLAERGRLDWAQAECDLMLRRPPSAARAPEAAYLRIKEARHLRGPALRAARAVAAWRERKAAQLDQPVRFILPDLAVVGVAQRAPATVAELKRVRGLEDRGIRTEWAEELIEAVRAGLADQSPLAAPGPAKDVPKELRPAIGLLAAWVAQLANDLEIDVTLLATRADLESFLREEPDARAAHGWRARVVGEPIRRVLAGDAALAFEATGRLALERRSHQALDLG
ncbi:MAG: ribonuclease D [Acidimicrobiales bacterium]